MTNTRERFHIPDGLIYLDGNSLGMLPKHVPARVQTTITEQWGERLIRGWNDGWSELPYQVGAKIAKLIGAKANEVIACDSTSINVYKMLLAAIKMRPDRRVIVSEIGNFPTDLYMAEGIANLLGGYELRFVEKQDLTNAIREDVAVVMLTEVDYKTGERLNMAAITKLAHDHGALCLWDLSHSAGAFPIELNNCNADFAVGCGYKYLNGGPGASAFVFVAERHQHDAVPALSGWLGHNAPFAFSPHYEAGPGMTRMIVGTPVVLSLVALNAALEIFEDTTMQELRQQSLALTDEFIKLTEPLREKYGFELLTPLAHEQRGSQVSLSSDNGYAIVQALIAANVIGDFRAPNIMRFGFTPLYLTLDDVRQAVQRFENIMSSQEYKKPEFQVRKAIT